MTNMADQFIGVIGLFHFLGILFTALGIPNLSLIFCMAALALAAFGFFLSAANRRFSILSVFVVGLMLQCISSIALI